MKDFVFYCTPDEVSFFSGIIRNIPKEIIDIQVGPYTGPKDFNGLPICMQGRIQDLIYKGYNVTPLDAEKLMKYQSVALSFKFFCS